MSHPLYTVEYPASRQLLRGFTKGLKLAFWLILLGAVALIVVHYFKEEARKLTSITEEEGTETHHDVRRNIAVAYAGKTGGLVEAKSETASDVWQSLEPTVADDGSGFGSRVVIHQRGDILYYRVIVGPYDPEISREFRAAPGWLDMVIVDRLGRRVAGLEEGLKIPFSSFAFHQQDGQPLGWLAAGGLRVPELEEGSAEGYQLGWMLPDSIRPRIR